MWRWECDDEDQVGSGFIERVLEMEKNGMCLHMSTKEKDS